MPKKKKTYLEMYLDNSDNNTKKKKKGNYFTDVHEQAILKFNDEKTSEKEKNQLFVEFIEPGFKEISDRVLDMPKFHNLPRGLSREQLMDDAYFRLVEKIGKFTPGLIGKTGEPVKAFSYFSTIAKNYILERKVRFEKILKNKADVEMSIDLSILSEDTLKKMSNYDKMDVFHEDYQTKFDSTRNIVIDTIAEIIAVEEAKNKKDDDFIRIGHYLMYLLKHWDKIEFMKKNEFMRILTLYTGLKQQQVSLLFKKFKTAVFAKLRPNGVIKKSSSKLFKDDDDDFEEFDESEEIEEVEEEIKPTRFKYGINSMEEFEMSMEFDFNDKVKEGRRKPQDNVGN